MMYNRCFFYTLDKEDEIVKFDKKKHGTFEYTTDIPYDEDTKLSPEDLIIANFFHCHACEVWNKEEHHPDHSVGMIVTDEELSYALHIDKSKVKKSIEHLLEKEIIGIVLLPDNKCAYHFVL